MWFISSILLLAISEGNSAPVANPLAAAGVDAKWLLPPEVIDAKGSLVSEVRRVVDAKFEPVEGDGRFAKVRSVGDLIGMLAPLARESAALDAAFRDLERERPEVSKVVGSILPDLLRSGAIERKDYDPNEELRDDGFHLGKDLPLGDDLSEPWKSLDDEDVLQQGAILIRADFATIKAVERDYPKYLERAGQNYEEIRAVEGSYRKGTAPEVGAFGTHRMYFRSDLPFPFSNYECDLVVVDRLDTTGSPRCDVYSTSSDFHWLAGVDTYLPIRDSSGAFQGWLIVRQFGFDLDDTPDGDSDRESALRSSLTNLKRDAERMRGSAELQQKDDVLPIVQH